MPTSNSPKVFLLHGLGRTSRSMVYLEKRLAQSGYAPFNITYPSQKYSVEELALDFVLPAIKTYANENTPIHFVTHSMGGIIVRQLVSSKVKINIGRVVMLAPPNGGSEFSDLLNRYAFLNNLTSPAAKELGTSPSYLPHTLGPAGFELGIIAGDRKDNPIAKKIILGESDGRVSVENTKLAGMTDFLLLPVMHSLMMMNEKVADETIHFLAHGVFQQKEEK